MRSKLVPWDYYRKRRNIQLKDYLKFREISDYKGLQDALASAGVSCPPQKEYEQAALELKPKPAPAPKKPKVEKKAEPAPKPAPKKRRATTRKKTETK